MDFSEYTVLGRPCFGTVQDPNGSFDKPRWAATMQICITYTYIYLEALHDHLLFKMGSGPSFGGFLKNTQESIWEKHSFTGKKHRSIISRCCDRDVLPAAEAAFRHLRIGRDGDLASKTPGSSHGSLRGTSPPNATVPPRNKGLIKGL